MQLLKFSKHLSSQVSRSRNGEKGKLDFFAKLDFYPVYPKNPVYYLEKIQFTTYTINPLFSGQTSIETFLFHIRG